MDRTLLLPALVCAALAARAGVAPDARGADAKRARTPDSQMEAARFEAAPPDRPADDADRGRRCAEAARTQPLYGDDYRVFMIKCMQR